MLRPDLAAAEAKVQAARAQVRAAQAAGKPTVSLTGSTGLSDSNSASLASHGAVGISVSIPLFTGYRNTYDIRSAEIQVEAREADRDQLRNQVSLDVWRAYQSLATERTALVNAEDLLQSALESENVARGRYKAGAGTLIDLLNAQSAAASARFQSVQTRYNWHLSKAALASALGTLDLAALPGNADTVLIDTSRSAPRK
jgi:outer membrane protein TolC